MYPVCEDRLVYESVDIRGLRCQFGGRIRRQSLPTSPVALAKKINKEVTVATSLFMVEVTGLEPTTFWSLTRRATKLRYTSICDNKMIILKLLKKCNRF